MEKRIFTVLEYDRVIEKIARKTTCFYGRRSVEGRRPLKSIEDIIILQNQTKEAEAILNSTEPFITGQLDDADRILTEASKGIPLQPGEILEVLQISRRSAQMKKYLENREALYPEIHKASVVLSIFPGLDSSITKAIDSDGRIKDNATSELSAIRRQVDVLSGRIKSQLESYLKNPDFLKMLQDPIITSREHRYVLPVKQEYRSQFPGIALDSSASGATVFMEPVSVLKMTNELKYQKTEEQREEEKIRLALSAKIAQIREDLEINLGFLGHYDALSAAARFSMEVEGALPHISSKPILDLRQARHPLIEGKAVPVDVHVGRDFLGLVVTGPNTGGKTVCLKTAGLLTLMALAGLPIPAGADSQVGLFTGLYADIGDEQSISQNLSTFSAHMTNIVRILPRTGRRTLVLLDEIGAGTDPGEGVALGSAILKYLADRNCLVLATTHYNELKVFASKDSRFTNAAVEFDEETLMPTYRLQIGLPGRSCAIRIAERLGVPGDIIQDATEAMGGLHHKVDSLLSEIDRQKTETRRTLLEVEEKKEEFEKLKEEYDQRMEMILQERQEILEQAAKEADDTVQEAFRELREARKDWKNSLKAHKEGRLDRNEVMKEENRVRTFLDRTISKLQELRKKTGPKEDEGGSALTTEKFPPGQKVKVTTTGRLGRIDRLLDSSSALVQLDNIRMEIPLSHLEPTEVEVEHLQGRVSDMTIRKVMEITDQLDIRGQRVEEGIALLEKYLDNACLANLESFRIVHGKGTGALREGIRSYLQSSPVVKSFREGELSEGGWGVTVVNL